MHVSRFPTSKRGYIFADRCPTINGTASFSHCIPFRVARTNQLLVRQQSSFEEFLRQKLDIGWVTKVQECGANFQDMDPDSIERSELIGISDVSYKEDMGTAAWRIFLYQSGGPTVDRSTASTWATSRSVGI
jgi:hypothetical protein